MRFKLIKDFYGFPMYRKSFIDIKRGLTVLVGRNGIGKTTLIRQIKDRLEKDKIPYMFYNGTSDAGSSGLQKALDSNSAEFFAHMYSSSEGQKIITSLEYFARQVGRFLKEHSEKKTIFLLFDAIDSGLSIDNIIEIKQLFDLIMQDHPGIYIIVSANTYEMCANEHGTFDVQSGEYIEFETYDHYKNFIIHQQELQNEMA